MSGTHCWCTHLIETMTLCKSQSTQMIEKKANNYHNNTPTFDKPPIKHHYNHNKINLTSIMCHHSNGIQITTIMCSL